jgi:branched-chain amino acid transport system ATP-binding protein
MPLLEIRGLVKSFGGLMAVSGLDFEVQPGEILGLIGPNGAGKTTVFNLISGFLSPSRGRILFRREDITGCKPHVIAKKGIIRTFQQTTLFDTKTVLENMLIGFHLASQSGFWAAMLGFSEITKKERRILSKAMEILDFMRLSHLRDEVAGSLPHGHQRSLGIAMALAAAPTLLLLDEPVTGMNPEETGAMMGLIRRIRERGVTILLVEHDMRAVMGLCERITVLNFGQKITEGTPDQIKENQQVIEAYLGVRRDVTRR